jgi:hypothetical protein
LAKWSQTWQEASGEDLFNSSQSETRIALGSHICWPNGTKRRNLIENFTYMLPAKFGSIWPSSSRGEDYKASSFGSNRRKNMAAKSSSCF